MSKVSYFLGCTITERKMFVKRKRIGIASICPRANPLCCWAKLVLALNVVPLAIGAASLTPADIGPPFAVQPSAGLTVTSGVTEPFFADLSNLSLTNPGITNILGDIKAFDPTGDPLSTFQITAVTVFQGSSTSTPPLEAFSLPFGTTSMTYTSTTNPLSQVTIDSSNLNLGFTFNSDSSFQYSYTMNVSGVSDGGFLTYDDVDGVCTSITCIPEPTTWPLLLLLLISVIAGRYWTYRRAARVFNRRRG
jgi:hypothetical protein